MALIKNRVIKMEFEEMLQTNMTGKVLKELRRSAWTMPCPSSKPSGSSGQWSVCKEEGGPKVLGFQVDLEYNNSFHLAIDLDLVFGKCC